MKLAVSENCLNFRFAFIFSGLFLSYGNVETGSQNYWVPRWKPVLGKQAFMTNTVLFFTGNQRVPSLSLIVTTVHTWFGPIVVGGISKLHGKQL